jgi:hypothetical protein
MNMEGTWNDNCQAKDECVGENLFSSYLYSINPLCTTLRLKPDVRLKTPASNGLSDVATTSTLVSVRQCFTFAYQA